MNRKVSTRYKMRVEKLYGVTQALRVATAQDAEEALKQATEEQLYQRTPLPVTRGMYNSIGVRIVKGGVEVGYNFSKSAPKVKYAERRVNMTGISKVGLHRLDMNPAQYLRESVVPKMKARWAVAQEAILRG